MNWRSDLPQIAARCSRYAVNGAAESTMITIRRTGQSEAPQRTRDPSVAFSARGPAPVPRPVIRYGAAVRPLSGEDPTLGGRSLHRLFILRQFRNMLPPSPCSWHRAPTHRSETYGIAQPRRIGSRTRAICAFAQETARLLPVS